MNEKEKAEDLCFKFQGDFHLNWTTSKRCALICCDEVLENIEDHTGKCINYWEGVKIEIQKL